MDGFGNVAQSLSGGFDGNGVSTEAIAFQSQIWVSGKNRVIKGLAKSQVPAWEAIAGDDSGFELWASTLGFNSGSN